MENNPTFYSSSMFNVSDLWRNHCDLAVKEDKPSEYSIQVSIAAILFLAFLLGTTTNGFIIWIKVYRMERTYRSILFLHLFISGFIFSLFIPLNVVYFASGSHWPFGYFMCRLNSAVLYLHMFLSALILALVSIDYGAVVAFPFRYHFNRTPRLASTQLLVIWTLVVCIIAPYFIFTSTYDCHCTSKCLYDFNYIALRDICEFQHQALTIIAFFVGFAIPFIIILSCFIISYCLYHRKPASKYTTSLKLIFSIQISFAICWFPFHVLSFLKSSLFPMREDHLDGLDEIGQPIAVSLVSINICINTLLYAFINPDFKKVFSMQTFFYKNCPLHIREK